MTSLCPTILVPHQIHNLENFTPLVNISNNSYFQSILTKPVFEAAPSSPNESLNNLTLEPQDTYNVFASLNPTKSMALIEYLQKFSNIVLLPYVNLNHLFQPGLSPIKMELHLIYADINNISPNQYDSSRTDRKFSFFLFTWRISPWPTAGIFK